MTESRVTEPRVTGARVTGGLTGPPRQVRTIVIMVVAVVLTARFESASLAAQVVSELDGSAAAAIPAVVAPVWDDIVSDWRGRVQEEGIVGASMALVVDGRLASLETEGMAHLAAHRAVDDETIYHWASITKTFTSISIMQLRDDGLLSLDDAIVDYVPELRGVHNPFGSMEDITIRQLMSHSAGFRAGTWPWAGGEPWHPHEPTEWSQLVAMIPYTEILFEPGSRFSYSNPGVVFLGRVIEAVSGDVFEAYVDKNIFRPLGMRRAYFDATPRYLREHRSNHYFVRNGRSEPGGPDFNTGITVSNGGLNAPVGDLARYLGFLTGRGDDIERHGAVLARASLEEMWEPVVSIGANPMGDASMGLSWFLYDRDDVRVVGHTGTQRAFYSFLYFDPVSGAGVIAAFNTGPGDETGPDTNGLRVHTSARVVNEVFPILRAGR
jgi:CubicO group peptidase (beta-lactamase class C family)